MRAGDGPAHGRAARPRPRPARRASIRSSRSPRRSASRAWRLRFLRITSVPPSVHDDRAAVAGGALQSCASIGRARAALRASPSQLRRGVERHAGEGERRRDRPAARACPCRRAARSRRAAPRRPAAAAPARPSAAPRLSSAASCICCHWRVEAVELGRRLAQRAQRRLHRDQPDEEDAERDAPARDQLALARRARRARSWPACWRAPAIARRQRGGAVGAHAATPALRARVEDEPAFAGVDANAGRAQHERNCSIWASLQPLAAQRQLAGLEAQVLDRRPLARPGRGGGLQHRLEVGVAGLAGERPQRLRLAQHDGRGVALDVGVGDAREGLLDQRLDRVAARLDGALLVPGPEVEADDLRATSSGQADPHRPPRRAHSLARPVADRARAAGARREIELAQVPEAAAACSSRCSVGMTLTGAPSQCSAAAAAVGAAVQRVVGGGGCGTSARARPPSRRTVATPSMCAQVSDGAFGVPTPAAGGVEVAGRRIVGPGHRHDAVDEHAGLLQRGELVGAARAGRPRRPRSAGRRRRAARPRGGRRRRPRAAPPRARRRAPRAGATPAPSAA